MSGGTEAGYREPGASFVAAVVLAALIALGAGLDLALGGGWAHLVGWAAGFVVVVGAATLVTRARRREHTVTVGQSQLRVGPHSLPRKEIVGRLGEAVAGTRVLGRHRGQRMPRGFKALALQLANGATVLVPTRHPDRLAAALSIDGHIPAIRVAAPEDLGYLDPIEQRAETLFEAAGMAPLPDRASLRDGLREPAVILVAGVPPVGFARLDVIDGRAHIEQLSVLPELMRRGIGSALLSAACEWAAAHGHTAVTVITFADVSWNAAFYAARGFVELTEPTPGLLELRDWERDLGLDRVGRRVVLIRALGDSAV